MRWDSTTFARLLTVGTGGQNNHGDIHTGSSGAAALRLLICSFLDSVLWMESIFYHLVYFIRLKNDGVLKGCVCFYWCFKDRDDPLELTHLWHLTYCSDLYPILSHLQTQHFLLLQYCLKPDWGNSAEFLHCCCNFLLNSVHSTSSMSKPRSFPDCWMLEMTKEQGMGTSSYHTCMR